MVMLDVGAKGSPRKVRKCLVDIHSGGRIPYMGTFATGLIYRFQGILSLRKPLFGAPAINRCHHGGPKTGPKAVIAILKTCLSRSRSRASESIRGSRTAPAAWSFWIFINRRNQ